MNGKLSNSVYEYFLFFFCCFFFGMNANVCSIVQVWGGGEHCSKGGMDINHQEEHGSMLPPGDGWGVSAVMSP